MFFTFLLAELYELGTIIRQAGSINRALIKSMGNEITYKKFDDANIAAVLQILLEKLHNDFSVIDKMITECLAKELNRH